MAIYNLAQFGTSTLFQSSSNCCFLTCIRVSQEAGKTVWYSHLLNNFPQFVVIHTVKGVSIVNEAEIDVFLELYSDSKQISRGCCSEGGMVGWTKAARGKLRFGFVHDHDCGHGFLGVYLCQTHQTVPFNSGNFLLTSSCMTDPRI